MTGNAGPRTVTDTVAFALRLWGFALEEEFRATWVKVGFEPFKGSILDASLESQGGEAEDALAGC